MRKLVSKFYVYDPRPNYPLLITAKRYWIPDASYNNDALTLIFAHGTGFHKELWEPTIDDLQELLLSRGGVKVREIWSIDAPNHGDAAILNENTLSWGYENICESLSVWQLLPDLLLLSSVGRIRKEHTLFSLRLWNRY